MIKKVQFIPYKIVEGKPLYFVGRATHNGLWRLPTGHVGDDKGREQEAYIEGVKRELVEELGTSQWRNFFYTGQTNNFVAKNSSDPKRNGEVKELAFAFDITGSQLNVDKKEFSQYEFLEKDKAIEKLEYVWHKSSLLKTNETIVNQLYPKIFIICGSAGAGKGAITQALLKNRKLNLVKARTVTTREKRPNESSERIFVDKKKFNQMEANGELIEKNCYNGNWYGASKNEVDNILGLGKNALMEIDLNGVRSFKKLFANVYAIFLEVDLKDLKKRLVKRATESPEAIEKRMGIARIEIRHAGICDKIVKNIEGKMDLAVKEIESIIRSQKGQKK